MCARTGRLMKSLGAEEKWGRLYSSRTSRIAQGSPIYPPPEGSQQHFRALCNPPRGTRAPPSPGEMSHTCRPCRHLQSPYCLSVESHQRSPLASSSFCILSFYALVSCLLLYYFHIFSILPCRFAFICCNSARIDKIEDINAT